eukprot:INCI5946.9.p1 GENE.INCI5946.9~~INCI5946.9.p1  ORF type:complete len:658 (-),score=113.42 INCI5946.9:444-2417(-)
MDALDNQSTVKAIVERRFNVKISEKWFVKSVCHWIVHCCGYDTLEWYLFGTKWLQRPHRISECLGFLKPILRGSASAVRQDHVVDIVCYQLLLNDLKLVCSGHGSLPPQVALMHKKIVRGEYMLQLEAINNIGSSSSRQPTEAQEDDPFLEPMETNASPGWSRMFKLLLTDGVQHVPAIEFLPISALHAKIPIGTTKLLIRDVRVRRGIIQLTPTNTTVLEIKNSDGSSNAHFVEVDSATLQLLHSNSGQTGSRAAGGSSRPTPSSTNKNLRVAPAAGSSAHNPSTSSSTSTTHSGSTAKSAEPAAAFDDDFDLEDGFLDDLSQDESPQPAVKTTTLTPPFSRVQRLPASPQKVSTPQNLCTPVSSSTSFVSVQSASSSSTSSSISSSSPSRTAARPRSSARTQSVSKKELREYCRRTWGSDWFKSSKTERLEQARSKCRGHDGTNPANRAPAVDFDDDFEDDFNEIDFDFHDFGDTAGPHDQKASANQSCADNEVNDFPDSNDFVDRSMDDGEPDQDELDMLEEVPEGLNPVTTRGPSTPQRAQAVNEIASGSLDPAPKSEMVYSALADIPAGTTGRVLVKLLNVVKLEATETGYDCHLRVRDAHSTTNMALSDDLLTEGIGAPSFVYSSTRDELRALKRKPVKSLSKQEVGRRRA